jgi:hypothetical protein
MRSNVGTGGFDASLGIAGMLGAKSPASQSVDARRQGPRETLDFLDAAFTATD